jgi:hypothetical protein
VTIAPGRQLAFPQFRAGFQIQNNEAIWNAEHKNLMAMNEDRGQRAEKLRIVESPG